MYTWIVSVYDILYLLLLLYVYRYGYSFFFSVTLGGGGCPSPGLTLNGTRVVPRSGMSPDFSTLSEVKFPARLPSSPGKDAGPVASSLSSSSSSSSSVVTETSSRICKIKCVSGQWVGPLCQGPYFFIHIYAYAYYFGVSVFVLNMSIRIKKNKKIYSREPGTRLFYRSVWPKTPFVSIKRSNPAEDLWSWNVHFIDRGYFHKP